MLYNDGLVLTFEFVDEILKFDHLNRLPAQPFLWDCLLCSARWFQSQGRVWTKSMVARLQSLQIKANCVALSCQDFSVIPDKKFYKLGLNFALLALVYGSEG